tara:strand:+ start:444 stop:755 length:312 start_codon:yes stop_codon:yes gene_type:complete
MVKDSKVEENQTATPWTYGDEIALSSQTTDEKGVSVLVLGMGVIVGIGLIRFGFNVLQTEPIAHWFEGLFNLVVQVAGWGSLLLGVILVLYPFWNWYSTKQLN